MLIFDLIKLFSLFSKLLVPPDGVLLLGARLPRSKQEAGRPDALAYGFPILPLLLAPLIHMK